MTDPIEGEYLFSLLDGLPLAIAQAGAYLQESGVALKTYVKFYEQQWKELMSSRDQIAAPLLDYPDRSIWTTWAISYDAIRKKDEAIANLLLLWSFMNNKDLWQGLFARACQNNRAVEKRLSDWIGQLANSELEFSRAMRVLCSY